MNAVRFFILLLASAALLRGQATVPAVSQAMPTRGLVTAGAPVSIHLKDYFSIPGVTGTVVQFDTVMGKFNVELKTAETPITTANFLAYTNRGAYNNSVIHRSVPGFVIQGGGHFLSGTELNAVVTDPAIQNERKFKNERGTISMAKVAGNPNSATSQWFINLNDNSADLDETNGGYAVFGRVLGTGMTAVDAIAGLPVQDARAQLGSDFKDTPVLNNSVVVVNSVQVVPVTAEPGNATSAISFTASSGNAAVVTTEVVASTLTLRPVAAGSSTITVRATDTNGNNSETTFTATVAAVPVVTTQPISQAVAAGANSALSVAASAGSTFQWQRNGGNLAGVGTAVETVNIPDMQPELAGLYTVVVSNAGVSAVSNAAILGVTTTSKVIGSGTELTPTDILHPNGKYFDQVLLQGTSAAMTADHAIGQITRMSFIDLDHDIVQLELAGPGTLSVMLDEPSGPAVPVNYNQPGVSYVRGHASIVISGATEQTNLSVFTVGRATSYDPTGGFNFQQPISDGNRPINNGNQIFVGKQSTVFDGIADIARISIISSNGKFGGIRAANASFYDVKGLTGIYAPGVTFEGPIYVGDISAYETATPAILVGAANGETLITGGNLFQANGQPVQVSGLTQLKFTAGSDSHGAPITAKANQGILHQDGVNVTSQIVVNP